MPTILVADDSAVQREVISGYLIQQGCNVAIAINGTDAVEKVNEILPDLVILDIVMPEMNGFQVCRQLKSNPKTRHIPIILCSTKNTQADQHWGMRQGADAYVVKSSQSQKHNQFRQELLGTVKQLLRQAKAKA
jgi:twitching motility two-component system response regulator PilH